MLSNHQMQSAEKINAVIFDLDDTLITWGDAEMSWSGILNPYMQTVADYLTANGHAVDSAELSQTYGTVLRAAWDVGRETMIAPSLAGTLHQAFAELGLDADAIDIQATMRKFNWQPVPGVKPYDDAHAVLDQLRADGYKIGLITNAWQPMWMRDSELVAFGLIDRLDARITSGDTGFIKPHPAIYWRMLGMLGTTPDRAVFVGDSPTADICGANATGLTSVQIDPPHLNREPGENIPDYTITALSELLPILESLK